MRVLFPSIVIVILGLGGCVTARTSDGPGRPKIVLLHGKGSSPEHVLPLAEALRAQGYLVSAPEMPWAAGRHYDRSLDEAFAEIDSVAGDGRVIIAGHSMGANVAIAYAANRENVSAVLAIGPGHTPESREFLEDLGDSVALAHERMRQGKGDEPAVFRDRHLGRVIDVRTTARNYLSYLGPEGRAVMPRNAPLIRAPLLWVVGTEDPNMLRRGRGYFFEKLPPNSRHRYSEVKADHMGTPDAARDVVIEWLHGVSDLDGQDAWQSPWEFPSDRFGPSF